MYIKYKSIISRLTFTHTGYMSEIDISIIAFDGVHRCGKGTQIELLQNKFAQEQIENLIIRWEHYRNWSGSDTLSDPYSERRQLNKHKSNYDEKSERLNWEIYNLVKEIYPNHLLSEGHKKWVIIEDRSIVGRYMFKHSEWEDTDNLHTFRLWEWNNLIQNVIIPDIIFVLQPSKEELIKRLNSWLEVLSSNYKEKFIQEKYELFYKWLSIIPDHIKERIIHITWDEDPIELHKYIWNLIQTKIL